jgi:acyl carrier protein
MSTHSQNSIPKLPQGPAEELDAGQKTLTTRAPELEKLAEEIKHLLEKLEPPKRKTIWDIFPLLTSFLGTVVLATLSLYVTQSSQKQARDFQAAEADRAAKVTEAQLKMQRQQLRAEELKALTAVTPLLTSHDALARAVGRQLLEAVNASVGPLSAGSENNDVSVPANSSGRGENRRGSISSNFDSSPSASPVLSSSLLDQFAAIALSSHNSPEQRVAATRKIGDLATAKSASPALRERAAGVAAEIAASAAPAPVKEAAAEVLANIKSVTPDEIAQVVNSQSINRKITEIILHHAGVDANKYKGAQTITNIAKLQLELFRGRTFGWHYAISADGAIWLGVPLDQQAIHARSHNAASVSVMLFMDGNKELPTNAQRSSLASLLRALFSRLKIEPNPNAPDGIGFHFHRDYPYRADCPGSLVTKEMVLDSLYTSSGRQVNSRNCPSREVFEKRVRQIVSDELEVPENKLTPTALIENSDHDELDKAELIMRIEEEFSVEISDEDAHKLKCMGDIYEYLWRLKCPGPS